MTTSAGESSEGIGRGRGFGSRPWLMGVLLVLGGCGFGTDTLNALNVWLAGVARPGDLRLAAGPMYQVTLGSGTGVASWFDRDHAPVTNDTIGYSGLGYGGGAQVAVGYGLLDLDKLQGLVELGGAWQTDLARSYYQVGLRVGIVPMVPRFKG